MENFDLSFEPTLVKKIFNDLKTLNNNRVTNQNIVAITSTFHRETGELAFILGYSSLDEAKAVPIMNTPEGVVAFYMDFHEQMKLKGNRLDWQDGYITIKPK